jgi:hypothetical protein
MRHNTALLFLWTLPDTNLCSFSFSFSFALVEIHYTLPHGVVEKFPTVGREAG